MAWPTWLVTLVLALTIAGPAAAQQPTPSSGTQAPVTRVDPNALTRPESLTRPPALHRRSGRDVLRIAESVPKIREELAKHRHTTNGVFLKGPDRWQVSFYDRKGAEIGQVIVWDPTGAVLEAWTGPQVAWTMARGYPGAFGRKATALYVWLPLLVLFVLPFVDPRRPLRIRHLDLLALCSLSVSLAFFNHGDLDRSVPTAYPPLVYLLARLLWIAYRLKPRRPRAPERMHLLVPVTWLAILTIFLMAFRIALNVTDSNVIDVGYSGVIGADHITHGHDLYGGWPRDDEHGDTYGPVNYLFYVPFELALPWKGTWNSLPAAHGAAILFDLLCVGGLFLLGRRIRGPSLGIVLAYAWASFPFTLFALSTNSNDALVAALLTGVLLVAHSPPARGVLTALAGLTKLAPLALAPVFATHGGPHGPTRRIRPLAVFGLAFLLTAAVALLPVWLQGDLSLVWERTVAFQFGRDAPFSVWGFYGGLGGLQFALQAATVIFAVYAAFLPRRPDVVGLAAVAGAILLLLQLGMTYWFYLYVVWLLPFAFVALFGRDAEPAELAPPAPEPEPAAERPVPA